MRYIIYTRVSSNKQTIENQLHECRQHVYKMKQKGDEVLEFSEPDKSTRRPMSQRKKLLEMMRNLRRGDQLVVYKVDRLARDKQELINIYCDITRMGVEIYGLKDPSLNHDTILMYAMIASAERKNISERTISGLNRKKANGERVGATTYGYRLDESRLQVERKETHSYDKPYLLIPDDKEQMQVTLMLKLRAQGFSYGDIAHELRNQGYTNRKGNSIHKSTILRVMRRVNPPQETPTVVTLG